MLTSGTLGAVSVDAEVVLVDLQLRLIAEIGHHVDTGE